MNTMRSLNSSHRICPGPLNRAGILLQNFEVLKTGGNYSRHTWHAIFVVLPGKSASTRLEYNYLVRFVASFSSSTVNLQISAELYLPLKLRWLPMQQFQHLPLHLSPRWPKYCCSPTFQTILTHQKSF